MAVKLGEALKKQLSAVVEMAPNPNVPMVKEAVAHGFYRSTSLLNVQSSMLRFFPNLAEFPRKLVITGVYNPETFQTLLERVSEQGYYDMVKRAVWNDDLRIIDPTVIDRNAASPATGELIPPHLEPPPPPPTILNPAYAPLSSRAPAPPTASPSQTPSRQQQLKERVEENDQQTQPAIPEQQEQEQQEEQQNQPEQNQPEEQTQPQQNQQSQPQPRQSLRDRLPRKKPKPSLPGEISETTPAKEPFSWKDALRKGEKLANKLGYNRLGNVLGKLAEPERLLGNLARSGLRTGANGLSQGAQGLARVGGQAASGAGRGLVSGIAALGAAIGVTGLIIIGIILVISALFIFLWWYDNLIGNSECNKPTGEMRVVKRTDTGSLEVNPANIEAAVKNGEKINFVIQASYQLACRTRTLSSVVVTDSIPAGLEYVRGSAKSGFYQTNGTPIEGVYDEATKTLTWTFQNFPMSNPVFIYFSAEPIRQPDGSWSVQDTWVMNEARVRYTETGTAIGSSETINFTGPSRGLMCVPGLDERLSRIFEEAGVAANVSPAIVYAIAKAENAGSVTPYSLDGKEHKVSPCGAHGLMQIQHINDGRGENYPKRCVEEAGGSSSPPETWDGLAAKYNEVSGGNLVNPDSDKDSIFGAAFYIKDNGWPADKNYIDYLTDSDAGRVAVRYLGAGNFSYIGQTVNSYKDAFARQGTCGGGISSESATQSVSGGINAE